MQDSIFTKIIKGEIPCHKVYEDDHAFAFLDIHPVTSGHTLVVPKRQVEFVWDLPDEDYAGLLAACKKIALHLRETLHVPYVGTKIEGVDVPHAHIHLIPFSSVVEFHGEANMSAEPDHSALRRLAGELAL